MTSMPAAEVTVDDDLVRGLLREQAPDLADLPLRPFANGWDNVMLRLGRDLLVRLPRRAVAAQLVANEQRWLPRLAPSLPLPVPVPVVAGRPTGRYPWPWSVVTHLPGLSAAESPHLDQQHAATALAGFLAALHRPAPPEAPANPFRGVPLGDRQEAFQANLAVLGDTVDRGVVLRVWDAASAADPWRGVPTWLHGDLHPANILLQNARISAVVDFGDITSGDPATDLAVAWTLLDATHRPQFWRTYAGLAVDDALRVRAWGWALSFAVTYLARSADNPTMHAIGVRTLAAVLGAPDRNRRSRRLKIHPARRSSCAGHAG